jgi:hypothetical protein
MHSHNEIVPIPPAATAANPVRVWTRNPIRRSIAFHVGLLPLQLVGRGGALGVNLPAGSWGVYSSAIEGCDWECLAWSPTGAAATIEILEVTE